MRAIERLARDERRFYPGALHPSMWRRGFFSCRVYTYPDIHDLSVPYISDVRFHFRCRALNSPSGRALLEDKKVFAEQLTARGLGSSAPEFYGTVTTDGFQARSPGAGDRLRSQAAVVLKPARGRGGTGVRIASPRDVAAMVAGPDTELIVQEQVRQHPQLARIHPPSLNTVRVLVVRLPGHGPVLAAAAHRWGVAGTGPVDNLSSGGLCSRVDLETGRLGPAVGEARARRRIEMDHHPDTGELITGVLVPQWARVRELALELMTAFPELDHVGWDLAVTDRGVRVIEGNGSMPAVSIFQMHGPFLTDDRLRDYYARTGMLASR
jgi:hypothetical protein